MTPCWCLQVQLRSKRDEVDRGPSGQGGEGSRLLFGLSPLQQQLVGGCR